MTLCGISLSACLFVWYLTFPWIESMKVVASCLFFFNIDGSNTRHRDWCTVGSLWIPKREEKTFSLIPHWQEAFFILISTPLLTLPISIGQSERWRGDAEELADSELGRKKSRVNWAQRDWELGELARRTRPILKWVSLTVPCIVLGHQRVGSCRTPEDRKELLCWRKESVGGFKADKETGRRSGPKQHEFRVSGLSKGWGSPIDRASRPWGIFCGKKG